MANDAQQQEALNRIAQSIALHGHHIYVVTGGGDPHYAYTIGLADAIGAELIMAGAYFYSLDDVPKIITGISKRLTKPLERNLNFEVEMQGSFSLRNVHMSWATVMMVGALDYYKRSSLQALQIVPESAHWTIDVPDLSKPWSATTAPAWRGLQEPWTYPIPLDSVAITDLGALRGRRVTEAMRWEKDEWELFAGAGPAISKAELRVVPIRVLLAVDESLTPIVNLPIGSGIWRDAGSEWHPWRKTGNADSRL